MNEPVKNRRPYNLYCVGGDVKPCSINQSNHDNEWIIKGIMSFCVICFIYSSNHVYRNRNILIIVKTLTKH